MKRASERITLGDVAKNADVSLATASRVLNGKPHVRADVRERVLGAARDLGYASAPKVLALLVPDSENPFFLNLRPSFQEILEGAGYHLVIASSDGNPERELALVEHFRRTGISGAFYISEGNGSPLSSSSDVTFPIIVLDRQVKGSSHDYVGVDNRLGSYLAVAHLARLGHTKLGHIVGLQGTSTALERRAGFLDAVGEHQLETCSDWRWEGNYLYASGTRAAESFLELTPSQRPTAVFASNDLMALAFIAALHDAGVGVPSEVSVLGFDDINYAAWARPTLTTVGQPSREIALEATQLMLERISEIPKGEEVRTRQPRSVVLEPTLIERGSTASPPENQTNQKGRNR